MALSHQGHFQRGTGIGLLLLTLAVGTGCRERTTRFEITNYRGVGRTEYFHEVFDECYYTIGPSGNVDVVARRHTPGSAGGRRSDAESITQIIHLRTVFRAIPGTTHAERSMINGMVNYAILSDNGGACFEGAGFLTFTEKRRKPELIGRLEQAKLHSNRRVGWVGEIFDRAELTGEFLARRNRKKVIRILNELNRVFPPQPSYQPPADRTDPM